MKEEKKWISRKAAGFTLVELIVVLVILSILSAVAVPTVLGFIDDGKAKECQSQVEALTAEVSSAKMAAEVNGEEGGAPFNVQAYINAAGASGKCPVDGNTTYQYKKDENKIVCPNNHGESILSGAGKFTVAVVEEERETEPTIPSTPEPPKTPEEPEQPTYNVEIPGPLEMEVGEERDLTVNVTDKDGNPVDPSRVTVEWIYPDDGSIVPSGSQSGPKASVKGEHEGGGRLSCEVKVDGKTVGEASADVNVFKRNLNLSADSLEIKEDENGKLNVHAVYDGSNEECNGPFTFECDKPGLTIESDGTVHGDVPGTYNVTVKVRDKYGEEKQTTVSVTVEPKEESEKSDGLFNPNTLQVWVMDRGATELHNNEIFKKYIANASLPAGTWEFVSGDGHAEINNGDNLYLKLFMNNDSTGPFKFKYTTLDGRVDYLTILVGYPIKGLQMPTIVNLQKQLNEEEKCYTVLDPGWTTDLPIYWELDPASTAKVEWSYESEEQTTNINMRMLGEGAFRIRAYAECEMTGERVYSKWSQIVTVGNNVDTSKIQWTPNEGQNPDITGVTLSPSAMTLEVGKSQAVTATISTKEGSVIDVDKVTYYFGKWGEPWDSIEMTNLGQTGNKDNTATVTGVKTGNSTITVSVLYDGVEQENISAQCQVTVEEPPEETEAEGEVLIDGQRFKATSWEEFYSAVENAKGDSYEINKKTKEEESPIYYDVDANGKRTLYVAIGTGKSYRNGDGNKGDKVLASSSFADYLTKNPGYEKEEFLEIPTPVKVAATIEASELSKNTDKYNIGDIVKVVYEGKVEYYISISTSDNKRVMSNINEKACWWPLEILP